MFFSQLYSQIGNGNQNESYSLLDVPKGSERIKSLN